MCEDELRLLKERIVELEKWNEAQETWKEERYEKLETLAEKMALRLDGSSEADKLYIELQKFEEGKAK